MIVLILVAVYLLLIVFALSLAKAATTGDQLLDRARARSLRLVSRDEPPTQSGK